VASTRNWAGHKTPIDVHKNVFDVDGDNDLVPMAINDVGRKDEREKEGKPEVRRFNSSAGKVGKVRSNAVKVPDELVEHPIISQHVFC